MAIDKAQLKMKSKVENTKLLAQNTVDQIRQAFIGSKEEAPEFLKDNEYIKRGYRIDHHTFCLTFKSLFTCHNESVNVWSHLCGSLIFLLGFIIALVMVVPRRFEVGRDLIVEYSK